MVIIDYNCMLLIFLAYKLKDNEIMSGSFEGCSGYKDDFKPRHAQKIQRSARRFCSLKS